MIGLAGMQRAFRTTKPSDWSDWERGFIRTVCNWNGDTLTEKMQPKAEELYHKVMGTSGDDGYEQEYAEQSAHDATERALAQRAQAAEKEIVNESLNTKPGDLRLGAPSNLEQMLDRFAPEVRESLPAHAQSELPRYLAAAKLYFESGTEKLRKCSLHSFVRCVHQGATVGLPIDGRLAHAVPRWNSKARVMEAHFMPDYKGLVVLARRGKRVKDAYAKLVYERDRYRELETNGVQNVEHEPYIGLEDSGEVIRAYACLIFDDGRYRYVPMKRKRLDEIRERTTSRDKQGNIVGPWVTDKEEMQKKTVLKLALKTETGDANELLQRAIDLDNAFYTVRDVEEEQELLPAPDDGKTAGDFYAEQGAAIDAEIAEMIPEEQPKPKELPKSNHFMQIDAEFRAIATVEDSAKRQERMSKILDRINYASDNGLITGADVEVLLDKAQRELDKMAEEGSVTGGDAG